MFTPKKQKSKQSKHLQILDCQDAVIATCSVAHYMRYLLSMTLMMFAGSHSDIKTETGTSLSH